MPDHRRNRIPGVTCSLTVNLLDRRSNRVVTNIQPLRQTIARVRHLMPFHIDAWVVLPDHVHAVWTLPDGDTNFAHGWQAIKMAFSKTIDPAEPLSICRQIRGERGIWQRRFWEHIIRDERDYAADVDYIHFNPVKHGHAPSAAAWLHSTFHRAVAQGQYPASWSTDTSEDGPKGERP